MQKIRREGINKYKILFYLSGVIILILYHIRYNLAYGDVVNIYGNVLKRGSEYFPQDGNVFEAIYNFTVFHYNMWSSRNVIEIVLIVVGSMPTIVWRILDIMLVILIGYCLDKLIFIRNEKIKYLCIFSFLMMYQVVTMSSAGWIATTINYSWVIAMGLYMFLTIQRIRREEHVSAVSYILALLAALFSLNHEQMNGMFLIFLSILLVSDLKDKKLKKPVLPFYVINILEFILIFFCPGNACRKNAEIVSYYPDYSNYKLWSKIYEGGCSLLKALFDIQGMAVITLAAIMFFIYLSYRNKTSKLIKGMAFFSLFYGILKFVYSAMVMLKGINIPLLDYRQNKIAAVLGGLVVLCILVVCYANIKDMKEKFLVLGALFAAAATKVVLGFSLAFLVSGERTSIYLTFVVIILILFLIERYEDILLVFKKKWFCVCLCMMDLLLFVWNYYCICKNIII